jgi:hypothetical protein
MDTGMDDAATKRVTDDEQRMSLVSSEIAFRFLPRAGSSQSAQRGCTRRIDAQPVDISSKRRRCLRRNGADASSLTPNVNSVT